MGKAADGGQQLIKSKRQQHPSIPWLAIPTRELLPKITIRVWQTTRSIRNASATSGCCEAPARRLGWVQCSTWNLGSLPIRAFCTMDGQEVQSFANLLRNLETRRLLTGTTMPDAVK